MAYKTESPTELDAILTGLKANLLKLLSGDKVRQSGDATSNTAYTKADITELRKEIGTVEAEIILRAGSAPAVHRFHLAI